jgi:hypothetical protein
MGVGVVVVGQVASTPSCFPFQKEVNFSKSILSFFYRYAAGFVWDPLEGIDFSFLFSKDFGGFAHL